MLAMGIAVAAAGLSAAAVPRRELEYEVMLVLFGGGTFGGGGAQKRTSITSYSSLIT